jgi:serine/threonine protein kinase/tetratricopeptide (TPR) repeat protein/DNA-directed RNA polymerase subunit RPC12/RpoP
VPRRRSQEETDQTLRDPDVEATRPAKRSSKTEDTRSRSKKSKGKTRSKSRGERSKGKSQNKSRTRARASVRQRKKSSRHPDMEVARLLVKRGFVEKARAVDALKLQRRRAKEGKRRIPFLQLLVKQRLVPASELPTIQDAIRSNTYICEKCEARAVIMAASQRNYGPCPRCGNRIEVEPASAAPSALKLAENAAAADSEDRFSGTATWRPRGDRRLRQFEPGMVAFDRYLLRDELGRGAMGVVYRARHLELGKEVALKVLVPSEDAWEQQVERFRREAAAVQKLRHDGIVQVHDFGSDGEVYYLTMDLVEGGESLHRRLKRDPSPSLEWRLGIVEAVARAISHAHERGVIHRDLKPANVLLAPDDTPLVADFGLAKDEEADGAELTRTQDRLGTPLFMAPEQIRLGASTVDGTADTWALGVILFVCATGRYPFRSRTVLDLYTRILQDEPDWDGTRYSAPDRPGIKLTTSSSGVLEDTKTQEGASGEESSDLCEATEAGARTPSGKLPRTLPEPPTNFAMEAPKPPFLPPPELAGTPPAQLRKIIRCALAKDPADRYPTAEDLADDLARFLAGEPVQGGGPGVTKRVRQALDRKQVLKPLALALGILVLLGTAAGVGGVIHLRTEQQRLAEGREREAQLQAARQAVLDLEDQAEVLWRGARDANDLPSYDRAAASLLELGEANRLPRAYRRAGTCLLQLQRFAEALEAFEKATSAAKAGQGSQPEAERVEALAGRARAALLMGSPEQANAAAHEALAAGDDVPAPVRDRLLHLLAVSCLQSDPPRAPKETQAALAKRYDLGSPPAFVLAYLARFATQAGDFGLAAKYLEEGPPGIDVEVEAARRNLALAQPPTDPRHFRKALRIGPGALQDATSFSQAARKAGSAQEQHQRMTLTQLASRAFPWSPMQHYYLGKDLQNLEDDPEGALDSFRRSAWLDPYYATGREFYLACLLPTNRADRLREAARFLRWWAERDPASPHARIRLAYVLARQGRLGEAWETAQHEAAAKQSWRQSLLLVVLREIASEAELAALPTKVEGATQPPRGEPLGDTIEQFNDLLDGARLLLAAEKVDAARTLLRQAGNLRVNDRSGRRDTLCYTERMVLQGRVAAASGEPKEALSRLEQARLGPKNRRDLSKNFASHRAAGSAPAALRSYKELESLEDEPRFKELLKSQRRKP